ncbi:hypothetical protein [Streptomyces sp. NPDC051994]|uniref:hypothetical protein n=1 Tax=unclassified Streptomyces TaxID=2593676 RepID=UPI00342E231E
MADNEKKPTDAERVDLQMAVRDMATSSSKAVSGLPLGGAPTGRTDFEGHHLNDMIDLVHNANPGHLISTGEALWAARNAIRKAAEELSGHIGYVDWEGESGNAFRTWGQNLVSKSHQLADFADAAGVQISVAGAGLASVSKAMPPRDERSELVKAMDIPLSKRVSGNASFDAAMRVEADRQEAINQMNRLSSFYAIAEQNLAAQTPPVFEPMPQVGVPAPAPNWGKFRPGGNTPTAAGTQRQSADVGAPSRSHVAETPMSHAHVDGVISSGYSTNGSPLQGPFTSPPPGTELNSTTAPPAPTPSQGVETPPSTVGTTGPSGNLVPPPPSGFVSPPTFGGTRRLGAADGSLRAGPVANGSAARSGRGGMNPVGRASAMEQSEDKPGTASPGQVPIGRGVTEGTPRPGSQGSARPGTTGRGNGIVGGRPSTTAGGATGSRMSSGAVVGGEGTPASVGSASRPGKRGVVGAMDRSSPESTQSNRRSLSNPDGVVGTPQRRATGARSARKGFTSGGEGLVRGSRDQQPSEPDEDEAAYRPCHLDEAEEIRTSSCPSYVPPATN